MFKHVISTQLQTFLAIDLGTKKTGLATGTRLLLQATAQKTIWAEGKQRLIAIKQQIAYWQPDALVIGVPYYPDGKPHSMTQQALRLARQLHEQVKQPVFTVDERYSTTEALRLPSKDVDATSAAIILQQFFAERLVNT